jgi:hypothetical protein
LGVISCTDTPTATLPLPLTPCYYHAATAVLPLPRCHCRSATATLPLPRCHCHAAVLPLPFCHCRSATATLPLPFCRSATATAVLPLPFCHCHCHAATATAAAPPPSSGRPCPRHPRRPAWPAAALAAAAAGTLEPPGWGRAGGSTQEVRGKVMAVGVGTSTRGSSWAIEWCKNHVKWMGIGSAVAGFVEFWKSDFGDF